RLQASSGLSEADIQKMVKDAETHAEEDKKRREEIELRNRADQMVYEIEKHFREMGDKLDASTKQQLDLAIGRTKEALKRNDINEIRAALDALTQTWHKAAEVMYQQAAESSGSQARGPASGPQTGDSQSVDADFEVVK
ncbi:MAG: Hsp70 family protein, partial [Candidatus Latescibacteria bacterium]|nr:Hsp70 family protein [Candidatus Latescibacterota bacterium]